MSSKRRVLIQGGGYGVVWLDVGPALVDGYDAKRIPDLRRSRACLKHGRASPASVSPTSSHDSINASDDHFTITLDPVPVPSSSTSHRQTTAEEWKIAAQENQEGIHYTREKFPSSSISFLAAQFAREPVTVEEDDRVVILDEVSEFALRVRVLRTGEVGVIPAWNVEGALERLARLNMIFNEVVSDLGVIVMI